MTLILVSFFILIWVCYICFCVHKYSWKLFGVFNIDLGVYFRKCLRKTDVRLQNFSETNRAECRQYRQDCASMLLATQFYPAPQRPDMECAIIPTDRRGKMDNRW